MSNIKINDLFLFFAMSAKTSAGILLYQIRGNRLEVFVAHPGGPYFKNKDDGAWSIPKGEVEEDEDLLGTAIREFAEETGIGLSGDFISLGYVKQRGGKTVYAWACEYHGKRILQITSNECEVEWPPRSGKKIRIPEIDRADFFDTDTAGKKINPAQTEFIERLKKHLDRN